MSAGVSRLIVAASFALTATLISAFDLEGHRGARGLAPENTLAAFKRALAIGVTTIETDLAVTRDDVLVISHDPFLNPDLVRGPDGRWLPQKGPAIRSLSLVELKPYDIGRLNPGSRYAAQFPQQQSADGERFPTLVELIELVKQHDKRVRLNIETKITPNNPDQTVDPQTFARFVIDAVQKSGMGDRVTVQSFDWRTLVEVKKRAPELVTACLTIETDDNDNVKPVGDGPSAWTAGLDLRRYDGSVPRLAHAAGCAIWSPLARNATAARIAESHALGMSVLPWTVNDTAEMTRLIDAGVDGIITDYPDRLRRVMAEKALALP
jgi:glycerophosphoryl diester phosphodiesterase